MYRSMRGDDSWRKKLARGLGVGVLLVLMPIAGLAHAKLVRSEPKAKAVLSEPPKLVELWFNEELEPGLGTIEVRDQHGVRVDRGEVTLTEENKKLQIELGELAAGSYTVTWKAVSTDEHTMRGSLAFSVSASRATPGPTASNNGQTTVVGRENSPTSMTPQEDQGEQISWLQTLARWISYLAMITLFGSFAFKLLVLEPVFAGVSSRNERTSEMSDSVHRLLVISLISAISLILASAFALLVQAATVFDKSFAETISQGLLARTLATGYGPFWMLQLAAAACLALILLVLSVLLFRNPTKNESIIWWVGLFIAAVLLVAPSWTGHAIASSKEFRLAVFTDWLHLVAAGFWVGGLFHLTLTLPIGLRSVVPWRRSVALHHAIRCFTRIAMPSVVLLGLAGLYNTWAHVTRLAAFWMTPYGRLLGLKLLLVGIMLLLGALHNFHFGKRAARFAETENDDDSEADRAALERTFLRSVAFEAAVGAVVLLVTAVLVFMTPARNHPAMNPSESGPSNSIEGK